MFPKEQRLTQKRLFDTLFKRGTWIRGKFFSLVYLRRQHDGKIGFVITKKIAKSAVVRNSMKRRLRAAFLAVFRDPEFDSIRHHYNIVVLIHQPTAQLAFPQVIEEIKTKLHKLPSENLSGDQV